MVAAHTAQGSGGGVVTSSVQKVYTEESYGVAVKQCPRPSLVHDSWSGLVLLCYVSSFSLWRRLNKMRWTT